MSGIDSTACAIAGPTPTARKWVGPRQTEGAADRDPAADALTALAAVCAFTALTGCASAAARPAHPVPAEPEVERTMSGVVPDLVRAPASTAAAAPDERDDDVLATVRGEATYYADFFDGRRTASGIVFSNSEMFAAHRDYPFGTVLRVTNLATGQAVEVRVVDRLPPARTERARRTVVDVSRRAAEVLDFVRQGRVRVLVEVLEWGTSA